MKVLWFTNTPSLYDRGKHLYHGGGWIEALEALLGSQNDVQLGISFFHQTDNGKFRNGNTSYYPIKKRSGKINPFKSLINNWRGKIDNPQVKHDLLKVVEDFAPDIIHIFGTEEVFASIQTETNIPVVIHLQGLMNPYYNTYFGVDQSKWNYLLDIRFLKNNIIGNSPVFIAKKMGSQANRERSFLLNARYVMGRTQWDENISKIYNPAVNYFHVDEVLRPAFYAHHSKKVQNKKGGLKIISTISPNPYKGIEVVLKTAKLLKDHVHSLFEWTIVGLEGNSLLVKHFEKDFGFSHKELNIKFAGRKNQEELVDCLLESDVFIHPSYIDNSPNSVCEAQMMGLLVIACHVGGLPSLVVHERSGILVPANGVFEIVHWLREYIERPDEFDHITSTAQKIARERHNREKILNDLMNVYHKMMG